MNDKMTWEREGEILEAAIAKYGEEIQIIVAIEEMSELIKALTKYLRHCDRMDGADEGLLLYAVREEMADVGIMLNQLSLIFGDQTEWELSKLRRLAERLGLEKEGD